MIFLAEQRQAQGTVVQRADNFILSITCAPSNKFHPLDSVLSTICTARACS